MRRQPPQLATWMLEHLTTRHRDDALAGDLLEVFRMGRSNGWYWRQVLATCVLSWAASLRARVPLLVFALMWSMAAPAWMLFIIRLAGLPPVLIGLVVWTILNSSFLCAGILVYRFSLKSFGQVIDRRNLRHAMWSAPLIFLPSLFTTFVLMNLYSYPGFSVARFATTPLSQIADLRMPADALRIPYVFALLCALWGAVPRSLRSLQQLTVEPSAIDDSSRSDSSGLVYELDPFTLRRFLGLMVGAGLINAMIIGFLLCRLPDSHAPAFASLLMRAIIYVALGALAGAGGTWLYWRSPASPFRAHAPIPFPLFALVCASGWVWVPSMVMFYEQISAASAFVAMIGAFVLTSGLRSAAFPAFASGQPRPSVPEMADGELFAESLYRPPIEAHGYVIALSLYAAGAALLTRLNYTAAALLAFSASVFAWKRSMPQRTSDETGNQYRQATLRLALIVIPAVLVTIWALLDGVAYRNRVAELNAALAAGNGAATNDNANQKSRPKASTLGFGGYESLILWPFPEKKQLLPPIPMEDSLLAPGTTRPLIIRFNGPYQYIQPPDRAPGPAAHQAHATPLAVDVQSNDFIPIMMDAHQSLSASVRIARCRKIEVEIANGDNRVGTVSLGVLLTDETSSQKRSVDLGRQPIISTEPGNFSIKSAPVFEKLHFAVPANARIRKFNAITVVFIPDIKHEFVAPKIAVQEFQLFAR